MWGTGRSSKFPPDRKYLRCGPFMTKTFILILFLVLTTILRGQSIENISKRLNLLYNSPQIKFDTTGFSRLPKFQFFCTSEIIITEKDGTERVVPSETEDPWRYYSVIDLNKDGLNDLIYSGPCNPYYQTGIFMNDGKKLQLVYDYAGEIVSIEKSGSGTIINCLRQAIGCDSDNELTEIVISKARSPTINRITYGIIPKLNLRNLKTVRVKGILRWSPRQDDVEKKDSCSDRLIKGNHLLLVDEATDAIQLDKSGHWLLIIFKKNRDESIIGWIKSE